VNNPAASPPSPPGVPGQAASLAHLRGEIDMIDGDLLDVLARRQERVRDILDRKNALGLPLRDEAREAELLAGRIAAARARGLSPYLVTRVFQEIVDDALRFQEAGVVAPAAGDEVARVGVLRADEERGGGLAARRFFAHERPEATLVAFETPAELAAAVADEVVAFGVLPSECARGGAAGEVYDQLVVRPVAIVGEELLEAEGAAEGAGAAVRSLTRFLVIAPRPRPVDVRIPAKTSLVLTPAPGGLLGALDALRARGLELTRLESRPRAGRAFEYAFYVELRGNVADPAVRDAVEALRERAAFLRLLGSYPCREDRLRTAPPARSFLPASEADATAIEEEAPVAPASPRASAGPPLARRGDPAATSVVEVGGVRIGGDELVVIAGPCAVESREQVFRCARWVKEHGGHLLRGGCFKPRTSPYSFQGLAFEGLRLLAEAGREYELPIVTEVLAPEDVPAIAELADVLQVGARSMQNFRLLQAVGRVDRPVLLKRGLSARLEELLHAAEYVLSEGNAQVVLCERGIRTFETATRNTLDLSAIPLLKQMTHLPIVVDPSHAAGTRELVTPLALAAQAVGPHGIMVEIHPEPEQALSDGPQALTFPDFEALMRRLGDGA